MDNNIISLAVAQKNEANVAVAVQKAANLINRISQLNDATKANAQSIENYRKEFNKLAQSEITVESILGGGIPQNSNTDTITAVITAQNKARQSTVEASTARLGQAITALADENAKLAKQVAELQTELLGITPVVVTESDITGTTAAQS